MINSVLLVDDDRITNFLHERILKKAAIAKEIHIAQNGLEALNFIVGKSNEGTPYPDLILLDINMPIMDGFEFLDTFSNIKKGDSKVVVLMLTTSSNNSDVKKAEKYAIQGYFNKPLTEEKLINVLNNYFS